MPMLNGYGVERDCASPARAAGADALTTVLRLVVVVVGLLVVAVGGWSAITMRRPSWLSERTIPLGQERRWGLAIGLIGVGVSAIGAFLVSDLFGGLGILGVLLIFVGVGFLIRAAAPGFNRR